MRWVERIAGLVAVAIGSLLILSLVAFTSMSDADPSRPRPAAEAARVVLGDAMSPIGLLLIAVGLWLAATAPKSRA